MWILSKKNQQYLKTIIAMTNPKQINKPVNSANNDVLRFQEKPMPSDPVCFEYKMTVFSRKCFRIGDRAKLKTPLCFSCQLTRQNIYLVIPKSQFGKFDLRSGSHGDVKRSKLVMMHIDRHSSVQHMLHAPKSLNKTLILTCGNPLPTGFACQILMSANDIFVYVVQWGECQTTEPTGMSHPGWRCLLPIQMICGQFVQL